MAKAVRRQHSDAFKTKVVAEYQQGAKAIELQQKHKISGSMIASWRRDARFNGKGNTTTRGKQGQHRSFSDELKKRVVYEFNQGAKLTELGEKYDIHPNVIGKWPKDPRYSGNGEPLPTVKRRVVPLVRGGRFDRCPNCGINLNAAKDALAALLEETV